MLIRLTLGILMQDLALHFEISVSSCYTKFTTWIKFLRSTIANALIIWLPKERIVSNLSKVFIEGGYEKTRCIIDCTEIFIERPKFLFAQAVTWSDYKKHNTVKYLIAISPTGYIMFVSDSYGGRTSDAHICQDIPFYRKFERQEFCEDRPLKCQWTD